MHKTSVTGKGGTGKSVVTTLLAKALAEKGCRPLIVDSDESNPGLYRMLGLGRAPADLIEFFGGPRRAMGLSGGSDSGGSRAESQEKIYLRDIPAKYLIEENNISLVSVGKITGAFEGCACPMAEVLKTFLSRLSLQDREIVLVDMEAGVEHFGRGVEKYIDTLFIVVEPSFESLALAGKITLLAGASGVKRTGAIINKVSSAAVRQKMEEELGRRNVRILGTLLYDERIAEMCLDGKKLEGGKAAESLSGIARILTEEDMPAFSA
jgi:CO dehydrogenase maturation factor